MQREEFFKTYEKYLLGKLPTEQSHPHTRNLSRQALSDLPGAFSSLKRVDVEALQTLKTHSEKIERLRVICQESLSSGARVFICGCGATGRLALTIESLWREKYNTDQIVAFMAGGDIALVHSLEGFEDYPEYGQRHLEQLGFQANDLLVAVTEGGETPYVLGAVEAAIKISDQKPQLLYCNPDSVLKETVERSRRVLENPLVDSYCLSVGPMALSGSTRMQASTVLQLALGLALVDVSKSVAAQLEIFNSFVEHEINYAELAPLTQEESRIYDAGEFVMYIANAMAITIFTDTTERSPTFSLPSFSSLDIRQDPPSLCYISLPEASTREAAWLRLLGRNPRSLNWSGVSEETSEDYLATFDFGREALPARQKQLGEKRQHTLEVSDHEGALLFELGDVRCRFPLESLTPLFRHTVLKMLINAHSTLVMGLQGRFESNMMTWVTATNGKLIDRACRYTQSLLSQEGIDYDYLDIADVIFKIKPDLGTKECLVLRTVETIHEIVADKRRDQ